jgi:hypothetical protein|tara:strand:- start:3476 stop:4330 length:855 start_codon:yes stop_codon:yes gene_type:complete
MKIALCLHGYFANAGGTEASELAKKYIQRKILDGNDVDIFVHSWDLINQEKILSLYNVTDSCFEEQKDFSEELTKFNAEWFEEGFDRDATMYKTNTIFRGLSYLYSRMKTIELKKEYENKNGFEYDCVVLARFDLSRRGLEHPQVYYVTKMNFDPSLDMQYLYSAHWNQMNHGYADHWFYSNSKNMDIVGSLYNEVFKYYQEDSEYVKAVTTGWPESNQVDEFSNECMRKKQYRSSQLKTFDKWGCIDNHKLYKWHFIVTGLHDLSRYIDITTDTKTPRITKNV